MSERLGGLAGNRKTTVNLIGLERRSVLLSSNLTLRLRLYMYIGPTKPCFFWPDMPVRMALGAWSVTCVKNLPSIVAQCFSILAQVGKPLGTDGGS